MKTVKELIRKYLIHCAETSMHSPSRAGNWQEDMRKLKKQSNKTAGKVFKSLIVLCMAVMNFINDTGPIQAHAEEIIEQDYSEADFTSHEPQIIHYEDDEFVYTILIEDTIDENSAGIQGYDSNFGYGSYDKTVTCSISGVVDSNFFVNLKARFRGSISSSLATVTSVSNGSAYGTFITGYANNSYSIPIPSAGPNDWAAHGQYTTLVYYNIGFPGSRYFTLNAAVKTTGIATIYVS